MFIATAVASAGAAIPVYAAVAAGEAIADAAITATVLNTVAVATNLGAAATSATLTANDAAELTGHGFLSSDQVNGLNAATFTLGTIGGFTSALPGFPGFSSEAADSAVAVTSTVKDSEEIGTDASKALSNEGETQSKSTSVLSEGDEESVNSSSSDSEQEPALGDLFDEVPDYTGPSGWLSTSRATPQTLERTTADFTDEQEQSGLNQNQQLDQAQTFNQAQQVPGGPGATSSDTVPVTTDPTGTANAAPGPSPLGNVVVDGVEGTNDNNGPLTTPRNPPNPLKENVPTSAIGGSQQQLLDSEGDSPIYGNRDPYGF